METLYYSQFGAVGDGVTDDFDAIIRTHQQANKNGSKVCADADVTYYIGGADKTAIIQTETDWNEARFIIDDRNVQNIRSNVFCISSSLPPILLRGISQLKKGQQKLDVQLPSKALVLAIDEDTMRFIREGLNQDNGTPQTDVFIIDPNGHVCSNTPIVWDFDGITSITAHPIDPMPIKISGGHFVTIANNAKPLYNYYSRGIKVTRSNVVVEGLSHTIEGEGEQGAPYDGFLNLSNCADITVRGCKLSGHKTYSTIGSAGLPVSMGSYDIFFSHGANARFENCCQHNDILDDKNWGVFGSNFTKNITFERVAFSRFDAHMGTRNVTIKDSEIGYMGVKIIGWGLCHVENTHVKGTDFIEMRHDYGSTWDGDVVIRNCKFTPLYNRAHIIDGHHTGQHDFGYLCYMPRNVTIDGLIIYDENMPEGYTGPKLFASYENYKPSTAKYPYAPTESVKICNLIVKSGKPFIICENEYLVPAV